MSDERVLCPTCTQQGLRSIVHEGGSKVTSAYYPPFFDEEGRRHLHDRNVRTRSFRCSNGHSWSDRIHPGCWCGWKPEVSGSFSSEPPTTAQGKRLASMPDIIVAGSPSEEPPAGYEVACQVDADGYEFPVEPRTFSRIRPK